MWRAVRIDTSIAVSHGLGMLVETGLEATDEVAESSRRWLPLDHSEAGDYSSAGGSEEAFRSRSRCRHYSGLGSAESQTPRPLWMSPPYAAWVLEFQGNEHFVLAGCPKPISLQGSKPFAMIASVVLPQPSNEFSLHSPSLVLGERSSISP